MLVVGEYFCKCRSNKKNSHYLVPMLFMFYVKSYKLKNKYYKYLWKNLSKLNHIHLALGYNKTHKPTLRHRSIPLKFNQTSQEILCPKRNLTLRNQSENIFTKQPHRSNGIKTCPPQRRDTQLWMGADNIFKIGKITTGEKPLPGCDYVC